LAAAFLLVLASNRLNNRNFSTVEQGVDSVFEDRLVVQEYIYTLNNYFHEKELFLANNAVYLDKMPQHPDIKNILVDFANTELTIDESLHLDELRENYAALKRLEDNQGNKEKIISVLNSISNNLDELSAVQLSEGKQLTQRSKRSLGMNQLLSTLEIVFLIIIGVLFIVIVFKREKSSGMKLVEEDS
jgi:CHASE3 domain sensor protein